MSFFFAKITAYAVITLVLICLTALSLQAFNYAEHLLVFELAKMMT